MKNWIIEESSLLKAWIVFYIISSLLVIVYSTKTYSVLIYFIWALYTLYLLICLRYIRGDNLGIWGYVWRALVSFCALELIILLMFFMPMEIIPNGLIFIFVVILVTPFAVWLLFCRDRITLAKKVVMYLRGMPV